MELFSIRIRRTFQLVSTPLVIKADQIVPNDTGMGWQPHDPTNPDDDIIIEI